jgi:hypothetical protein
MSRKATIPFGGALGICSPSRSPELCSLRCGKATRSRVLCVLHLIVHGESEAEVRSCERKR